MGLVGEGRSRKTEVARGRLPDRPWHSVVVVAVRLVFGLVIRALGAVAIKVVADQWTPSEAAVLMADARYLTCANATDVIFTETSHAVSAESSDTASAKAAHMTSAKAAAKAADVAAAEAAAHVATTTTKAAATAGLRTRRKKAAGKQRSCQNHHHSSCHNILLFGSADLPPQALQDAGEFVQRKSRRRDKQEMGVDTGRLH